MKFFYLKCNRIGAISSLRHVENLKHSPSFFRLCRYSVLNFLFLFLVASSFILGNEIDQNRTGFFRTGSSSQFNDPDTVNIRTILQAQIDSAKERNKRGEIRSYCSIFIPVAENIIHQPIRKKLSEKESKTNWLNEILFERLDPRLLLFIGFSAVVFIIVFIRRFAKKDWGSILKKIFKAKPANLSPEKDLKANINSIREEKKIKIENPELNIIRSNLVQISSPENLTNSISGKAKELKIAKGEILLAAKIKSFQLAQLTSNNK